MTMGPSKALFVLWRHIHMFDYSPSLHSRRLIYLLLAIVLMVSVISESANASNLAVYSERNKVFINNVSSSKSFTITNQGSEWTFVKFNQPTIPIWVSQKYVVKLPGNSIKINATSLNARFKPSLTSKVLSFVEYGFESQELEARNGFLKIYAPQSWIFAVKSSQLAGLNRAKTNAPITANNWSFTNKDKSTDRIPESSTVKETPVERSSLDFYFNQTDEQSVDDNLTANNTLSQKTQTESSQEIQSVSFEQAPDNAFNSVPEQNSSVEINQKQTIVSNSIDPLQSPQPYLLAPGDAISMIVFGEPDLSISNVRIPQSGRVSFPLIGSMLVIGKTTKQLEDDVGRQFAQGYVRNPKLSITISSYRPIFIRGAVSTTGSFPYTEGLTVAQALALAGGTKNSAKSSGISISREGETILSGLSIDSQTVILSGDIITVEEEIGVSDEASLYIYLHGEVKRPGEYEYRRGLTVEKAVVLAGGFTLRASKRKITVSRQNDNQEAPEKMKKVELYLPVQPGDIINVGARWF